MSYSKRCLKIIFMVFMFCLIINSFLLGHNLNFFLDSNSEEVFFDNHNFYGAVTRTRASSIHPQLKTGNNLNKGEQVNLNLFSDINYTGIVERLDTDVVGVLTVRGSIEGFEGSFFMISTLHNYSRGAVYIPQVSKNYIIKSREDGSVDYIIEIDNTLRTPDETLYEEAYYRENILSEEQQQILSDASSRNPLDTAEIDIMVVYTPQALAEAGSELEIQTLVANAMTESQIVFDNSETFVELNLVYLGMVEEDYLESGNSRVELRRITASPFFNPWGNQWSPDDQDDYYQIAGLMEDVHSWREIYGADLVALITSGGNASGIGWVLNRRGGRPDMGFSSTRLDALDPGGFTFIHEIGHNMGCSHHKDQNYQPGPTNWFFWPSNNWSAGWRWETFPASPDDDISRYCTVMTYSSGSYFEDGNHHAKLPYFSNPNVSYRSYPTGHPEDGDNARTIRATKHVISAYSDVLSPGGLGIPGDAYRISTLQDLYWIASCSSRWGYDYIQINDIDASVTMYSDFGQGWKPIGYFISETEYFPFHGSYNGLGHTIDNLFINRPYGNEQGLFGNTNEAIIQNLGLTNVNITGNEMVGGIAGMNYCYSLITNCYTSGTISGYEFVGGIAGYNHLSYIYNSFNLSEINSEDFNAGGITGANTMATVCNSFNAGSVSGNDFVGGITGMSYESEVNNSFNRGEVIGFESVGGIVGWNMFSQINYSYNTGYVDGLSYTGGLVGENWGGSFNYNYWDTETSGQLASPGGFGRTTSEMSYPHSDNTYVNWDFEGIWNISVIFNDGYPHHKWWAESQVEIVLEGDGCYKLAYLNWTTDNIERDVLGFNLYRNLELVNDEPLDEFFYYDYEVDNDYMYFYYLTIVYSDGESSPSNIVTVTPTPPVPENFSADVLTGSVEMQWSAPDFINDTRNSPHELRQINGHSQRSLTGYNLYRNNNLINQNPITDLSFIDYDVFYGETHTYAVKAVYDEGESDFSEFVTVTVFYYNQAPIISNVNASQRNDGSMLVDIFYDLYNPEGENVEVSMKVSNDDGFSWDVNTDTILEGSNIGEDIENGAGKHIVWDINSDYPGIYNEEFRFKIIADDSHPELAGKEWISIPAGEFTSGENGELVNYPHDYEIMKYNVTNKEYLDYLENAYERQVIYVEDDQVMGYYHFNDDPNFDPDFYQIYSLGTELDDANIARINYINGSFTLHIPPGFEEGSFDNHPVVGVSWFGAVHFARYYGLRVPSIIEWEKAARGVTGYDYPWGNEIHGGRANYLHDDDIYMHPWYPGTTPVGYYNGENENTLDSPSPYGVYDMSGNVFEWLIPYGSLIITRFVAGGSWNCDTDGYWSVYLKTWSRMISSPDVNSFRTGLRLVRDEASQLSRATGSGTSDQVTVNTLSTPSNLTAVNLNGEIELEWDPPGAVRSDRQLKRVSDFDRSIDPGISQKESRDYSYDRRALGESAIITSDRDLIGYNVYRNDTLLNQEIIELTHYTDTSVEPGFDYQYIVTAVYTQGESFGSNTVEVPSAGLIYGDLDRDGVVTPYDASIVLQYYVGLDPIPQIDPIPWTQESLLIADVDLDGQILPIDASIILRYYAGLIDDLPYSQQRNTKEDIVTVDIVYSDGYLHFYSVENLFSIGLEIPAEFTDYVEHPINLDSEWIHVVNVDETVYKVASARAETNQENLIFSIGACWENLTEIEIILNINNQESKSRLIEVTDTKSVPGSFFTKLIGNYPNPFNSSTAVKFALSEESLVTIDLFNIKGQKIKSLVNGVKQAGQYDVIWSGQDKHGNKVSSGIYLYIMKTSTYSEIKKMMFLK